ncbi:mitochondrial 54S ribosomal protein YmL35 [Malassezia sp. CBS 17886]|nr:mitochondrial 54S ribosomal protein YmL35 [Malassezia sp. CBS 17886]
MQSTQWKRPVDSGSVPVYDEALAYVDADSRLQRTRLEKLRGEGRAGNGGPSGDPSSEGGADPALVDSLEIVSEMNLPAVRASFLHGDYDLRRPVFRHLREQAWRVGGPLEKLAERLTLTRVLPDVVPSATPTVDVQVFFGEGAGIGDHGGEGGDVLAGVFVDVGKTLTPPTVRATAFHNDTRKYTLMLVDPDVPDEENQSFSTYVHWLVTDIPLSTAASGVPAHAPTPLAYVPPHPQRGSPYHRYTTLLYEQRTTAPRTPVRDRIDVAAFAADNDLELAGLHFWRAQWTEANSASVSHVYETVLQTPEPRFGRVTRTDRLKDDLGVRHSKYF